MAIKVNLTQQDNSNKVNLTKGATKAYIDTKAEEAKQSAIASEVSADNSNSSALESANSASASLSSANNSEASAINSANSASTSTAQAVIATTKANEASTSASNALASEQAASTSESNALASENAAATSEANASTSEANALTYSQNALASQVAAELAETHAETAETNAETAEANAEIAETAAEAAQASAESAQSSAEAAQASATASANSATASAASASSSAQDAQSSEDDAETSAISAAASALAASNSASSANTSANTATSQASIATTKASEALTSANNAATSETNSENSAIASSNSAATSAGEAIVATTQAGIATTQAGIATTKANEASISESNALTSENNASTSESNAATSASNALTSANNASSSASAAATSESNAASSATSALNSLNTFQGQYTSSATAPTSPNEGDLWFDETAAVMKVYNGLGFINAGSSVNGTSSRVEAVATEGQTTFTTTGYDSGYVDVYLNGVKLIRTTDFTDTDGTDIILTTGATAGDEVSIVAYGTFLLADHYSKAEIDPLFDAKQDNLVSGTNIKTVGGTSLLGSGDIPQYTPPTDQGANNYLAGDGTYKQVVVPTNVSELTNDTGFITGVSWSEVTSKPSFATVATSGSYNDLSNKPTIPTVPTNVSSFTNDAGYVTSSGNTIIGTDADINTSGSTIIDNLYMTDGVITSHGTRTLTAGDIGAATSSHTHDYVPERSRSDWNDDTVIGDVIGQMAWQNYGNNHTIFDASKSVSPSGTSVNNTNPSVSWSATYPTLMGWNGTDTYGVRVDRAKQSDTLAGYSASTTRNAANTIPIRDGNGFLQLGWINTTSGNTTGTITDFYVNTNDGYIRKATKAHVLSQLGITSGGLSDAGKSFATNGYQKLSNGLIIQWGIYYNLGNNVTRTITFPIAFPTACRSVTSGIYGSRHGANAIMIWGLSTTRCYMKGHYYDANMEGMWIAIGH